MKQVSGLTSFKCNVVLVLNLVQLLDIGERVEVQLHTFLTLAPDGDEWASSLPGRFTPR